MSVGLIDSAVPSLPGSVTGNIAMEGSGLRVVVADDDPRILMTVASFLLKAGFAVHRAATGEEALQAIADDPDIMLLVTDFSMPAMSGAALISEAVRVRPHLRAMLMTGYPDAEGLGHLPSHVPVLVKPFRRAEFLAKIDCLADEIREAEPV
jgi:CheY-like chemotaxis protein